MFLWHARSIGETPSISFYQSRSWSRADTERNLKKKRYIYNLFDFFLFLMFSCHSSSRNTLKHCQNFNCLPITVHERRIRCSVGTSWVRNCLDRCLAIMAPPAHLSRSSYYLWRGRCVFCYIKLKISLSYT